LEHGKMSGFGQFVGLENYGLTQLNRYYNIL